ncbi:MAG: ATP-binding protein [Pseudomonadota bacterium]
MAAEQTKSSVSAEFVEHLIRGINHDIGAPARHVGGFARLLSERDTDGESLDEQQRDWLSIINEGGQRIQAMLNGLTALPKLSRSRDSLSEIDLKALFEKETTVVMESGHYDSRLTEVTLTGDWPVIIACQEHWLTLFSALLDNALKFRPDTPGHVTRVVARCTFRSVGDSSSIVFTIIDNGIGLEERQIKDLARPFKRLRGDDYEGLGLGLTYCRFIAELNDAELTILPVDSSSENAEKATGLLVRYVQPIDPKDVSFTVNGTDADAHQRKSASDQKNPDNGPSCADPEAIAIT